VSDAGVKGRVEPEQMIGSREDMTYKKCSFAFIAKIAEK
jgi:hypothetical protein